MAGQLGPEGEVDVVAAPEERLVEPADRLVNRPVDREFNPDYSAVIKDLKRIGTLAGSFFVLLIVLSFFLR